MSMNVETLAFATAFIALFGTILGVGFKAIGASRGLDEFRERFARLEVKADALWDIYGLDAIREARMGGLTERRSNEVPSAKFLSMIPISVRHNIEYMISLRHPQLSASDLTLEVWVSFQESLTEVAEEHDVSIRGMYGAVSAMCSTPYRSNDVGPL